MTCLFITVVRKMGLEYTGSQLIQNINAGFKINFSQFSTSDKTVSFPKLEISSNTAHQHPFPLKFPWHLVIPYLTTLGAAQFLRFPPTWIYHVIKFRKTWNTSLQKRSRHPSSLMYQAGLCHLLCWWGVRPASSLVLHTLGLVKNVAPWIWVLHY